MGYVHQQELLFSHLSVREHLTFHAVTLDECLARVEDVLHEVDMMKVGDSQIGGGEMYMTKGLGRRAEAAQYCHRAASGPVDLAAGRAYLG